MTPRGTKNKFPGRRLLRLAAGFSHDEYVCCIPAIMDTWNVPSRNIRKLSREIVRSFRRILNPWKRWILGFEAGVFDRGVDVVLFTGGRSWSAEYFQDRRVSEPESISNNSRRKRKIHSVGAFQTETTATKVMGRSSQRPYDTILNLVV